MRAQHTALVVCALACVAGKREPASDTPRWMNDKEGVRIEIVHKLLDGGDSVRAMELLRLMREDGITRPEIGALQGAALRQQGMAEDAERLLVQAAKQLPKSGFVQRELCVLYADEQLVEPALAACEKATKLDPVNAAAWNNLGFLRLSVGDADGAVNALQQAVERNGTEVRYRNNLAFAHVAAGNRRAALQTFLTTNTPADAHYNLGAAYEREGDSSTALAAYRRALRFDPGHEAAEEAMTRLGATDALPAASPDSEPDPEPSDAP